MFHGSSDDLFTFYGSSSPIILPVEFVIFPAIETLIIPSEVNPFTVYWYAPHPLHSLTLGISKNSCPFSFLS